MSTYVDVPAVGSSVQVGMNGRRPAASELCWAPGAQRGRSSGSFTPPPACGPAVYEPAEAAARTLVGACDTAADSQVHFVLSSNLLFRILADVVAMCVTNVSI